MIKQAVIIAGGEGKRLKPVTGSTPKILAKVGSETLLEFQLRYLKLNKIKKVHFCLGYGSDEILSKIKSFDLNYTFSIEPKPLGTYGALQNAYEYLDFEFFVLYGDIILDYDINFGYKKFKNNNSDLHLILRNTEHPEDSDIVNIDSDMRVVDIERSSNLSYPYKPLGNTAIFFCTKSIISPKISHNKQDIFKDFIKSNINKLNISSEITLDFIRDVGTEKRYFSEINNYKNQIKQKKNYIFIDRDGTIIDDIGNYNKIKNFKLKPGVITLLKTLQEKSCKIILITNQPSIAKGFNSVQDIENIHSHLQHELIKNNLKPLDAIFYCPHHPEKGYKGEVTSLKIKCKCRKPGIGLVTKAIKELNIKNKNFYFIGDTDADFLLAKKFNAPSFIVLSELTKKSKINNLEYKLFDNLNSLEKELIKYLK